eukprot:m.195391 g.195391  ORF g.195391 m.195391 type:complete len:533 (-) comp32567_c1_seq1:67-1665(-)
MVGFPKRAVLLALGVFLPVCCFAQDYACGAQVSSDCASEFSNSFANSGNYGKVCTRCEYEGGASPLRLRCEYCCSKCGSGPSSTPAPSPLPTPALSSSPIPAPSPSPTPVPSYTCGTEVSNDCVSEFSNTFANSGNYDTACDRCASEGGATPLRMNCEYCCSKCGTISSPPPTSAQSTQTNEICSEKCDVTPGPSRDRCRVKFGATLHCTDDHNAVCAASLYYCENVTQGWITQPPSSRPPTLSPTVLPSSSAPTPSPIRSTDVVTSTTETKTSRDPIVRTEEEIVLVTTNPGDTTSEEPDLRVSFDASSATAMGTGPTAGISIGVIMIMALCVLLTLFVVRKRKQKEVEKIPANTSSYMGQFSMERQKNSTMFANPSYVANASFVVPTATDQIYESPIADNTNACDLERDKSAINHTYVAAEQGIQRGIYSTPHDPCIINPTYETEHVAEEGIYSTPQDPGFGDDATVPPDESSIPADDEVDVPAANNNSGDEPAYDEPQYGVILSKDSTNDNNDNNEDEAQYAIPTPSSE